ncbi:MAG: flagellar hook capping protein, partial [Candidatus Eisenbacteria bacterium]|nr:flagellar hook capping protein [Candidatus Eisenbacteria bacterium]
VGTIFQGSLGAGEHAIEWNGLDADGRRVPNGVYSMRVVASSRASGGGSGVSGSEVSGRVTILR